MERRFPLSAALGWAAALFFAAGSIFLLARAKLSVSSSSRVESAPVVLAVQKIARLATIEIEVSDVIRYEEVKSFLIFDFPKSAVLRLRGRVLGGFDLQASKLDVTPDPARRVVSVRMPAPTILAIDPRFEWFDERSGLFNPITPEDRNRWMRWARGALARNAKEAGIQSKSEDQARRLLEGAASALGWKAEVTFARSTMPVAQEPSLSR
jgi:hypothetical protein